jgi:hypothetical protein
MSLNTAVFIATTLTEFILAKKKLGGCLEGVHLSTYTIRVKGGSYVNSLIRLRVLTNDREFIEELGGLASERGVRSRLI